MTLRPLQYPSRIEARYRRYLRTYVTDMRLDPRVLLSDPRWRQDALADDLSSLVDTLKSKFRGLWPESKIRGAVNEIFQRVNAHNVRQFNTQWGKALKTVSPIDDLGLQEAFIGENVSLIKSLDARYFGEVERMVMDAIRNGQRVEGLSQDLRGRFGVSKSRANLIARDQISSLVSQMTTRRLQEAGVEEVKWSTSMDERVRKSHREVNGRVYNIKIGIYVDGKLTHAGLPILCRCSEIPVINEFET
jgi:SPP1 gp7 family putative phage head morphogenesis protein